MNTPVLLVDLAAKSVVILCAAWLLSRLFRNSSAAAKHLIWLAAFCVLLAAPILSIMVPAKPIPLMQVQSVQPSARIETAKSLAILELEAISTPSAKTLRDVKPVPVPAVIHKSAPESTPKQVPDWTLIGTVAVAGWLLGAAIVAIQSLYALAAVGSLRRRSHRFEPLEGKEVDRGRLTRQLGVTRPWELRVCAGPKAPAAMTWGVMNPIVMIPQESASWSQERLEAVLLHELAHVRRFDSVSQLIATLACAVYWFNPAVWLCARAMRAEAEIAADDTVLSLGVKPSDYARELVRIAAELGTRRQPYSTIGVPIMKKSKIESRVQAILDPSTRRRRGTTKVQVLTTIAIAVALVAPISVFRAVAVPFEPHLAVVARHATQTDQDKAKADEAKAKLKQARAQLEAARAKLLAEVAARRAEQDKRSAENSRIDSQASKRLAEEGRRMKEASERVSENARRLSVLDKNAAETQARRAAQNAQAHMTKAQVEARLKLLLKQDRDQKAALAQLHVAMQQIKAQRTQLEQTQRQLVEALKRLHEAKGSDSDLASADARLKALYQQGLISKEDLDAQTAAKTAKAGADALAELAKGMDTAHSVQFAEVRLQQGMDELAAAQRAAEDVRQRYQVGVIQKSELDKAQLEVAKAQSNVRLYKIVLDSLQKAQKK